MASMFDPAGILEPANKPAMPRPGMSGMMQGLDPTPMLAQAFTPPPRVGMGTPADPAIALVTNMMNLIPQIAEKTGTEPPGAAAPGASGGAMESPAAATAGAPTNIVPPGMAGAGAGSASAENPLGAVQPPPMPQGVMASSPGAPQMRPAQSNLMEIMMNLGSGRGGGGRGATQLPFLSKFLR